MSSIGFTGTQEGMTIGQARTLYRYLRNMECEELHHGDCLGADEAAHYIARSLGCRVILHPPTNPRNAPFAMPTNRENPSPISTAIKTL